MFDIFGFRWGKLLLKVNKEMAAQVDGPSRLDFRPTFDRLFERSSHRHGRWVRSRREGRASLFTEKLLVLEEAELKGFRAFHPSYYESPKNGVMLLSLGRCSLGPSVPPVRVIRSAFVGSRALDQACGLVVEVRLSSLSLRQ